MRENNSLQAWLNDVPNLVKNINDLRVNTGRRGDYAVHDPRLISWETSHENYTDGKPILALIVEAECDLMWEGKDYGVIQQGLYDNDEDMLAAYKRLMLMRLLCRNKSRNAIICEPDCCMCLWQFFDDTLFVYSRSMDLQRAGKTDILVVNEIARRLGANYCIVLIACPHVYLDKSKIARRPK